MFDAAIFIEEIRKRPGLWDVKSGLHNKHKSKDTDWDAIGGCIFPKWGSMTEHEKAFRAKELTSKWKNIKDIYRRSLRKKVAGMGSRRPKKYIYHEQLSFLNWTKDTVLRNNTITRDVDEPVNGLETNAEPEEIVTPPPTKKSRKEKRENNQPEKWVNITIPKKEDEKECGTNIREDRMFFLSLAPMIYGMSEDVKIQTKIEIMKVIQKNRQVTSHAPPEDFANNFIEVSNIGNYEDEDVKSQKLHNSSDDSDNNQH